MYNTVLDALGDIKMKKKKTHIPALKEVTIWQEGLGQHAHHV